MAEVTIYRIKNILNGRVYIGSSITPEHRKQTHLKALKAGKHYNKLMQRDYTEQNGEGFRYSTIDTCTEEDRNIVELMHINENSSFVSSGGYNVGIPSQNSGSVSSTFELSYIPYFVNDRYTVGTNLIYSYLLEMYKTHQEKGTVLYLRHKDIEAGTGLTEKTSVRAVKELINDGLVETLCNRCFNTTQYIVHQY